MVEWLSAIQLFSLYYHVTIVKSQMIGHPLPNQFIIPHTEKKLARIRCVRL